MPKLKSLKTKNINGKWQSISKWKCDKCRFSGTKEDVEEHEQIHYSKPKLEYILPDLENLPVAIVDFDCVEQMRNWRYKETFPETWEWEGPGRYALYDLGTDHHGCETYRRIIDRNNMKLSKEQKDKLETLLPTLNNLKLRKALKRAIKTWETEPYGKGRWGVIVENGEICVAEIFNLRTCCLLGAAALGAKTKKDRYPAVWAVTGFSRKEVDIVVSVFDNGVCSSWVRGFCETVSESEKQLIKEVLEIQKILFPY